MNNQTTVNNQETREQKFYNFFNSLSNKIEIDFNYFLTYGEQTTFEEIQDTLEDNQALTWEVLFYGSAMEYLRENDPSLTESLQLANEYGQTLENLNSETLASILKTENLRSEFLEMEAEISDFLEELQELEEQEEDEIRERAEIAILKEEVAERLAKE